MQDRSTPHELKAIERMPATWHGQILLLSLLSALVFDFLVWYLSWKQKGLGKKPPSERPAAGGRLRRKGGSH